MQQQPHIIWNSIVKNPEIIINKKMHFFDDMH